MILGGFLLSAILTAPAPPPEAHRAEIEAWRARRMTSLKRPDGWLSLVGLFWLEPGENRFGSDPKGNRVVFPKGTTPGKMGSLDLSGTTVTVRTNAEAGLTSGGKPVSTMVLKTDADGEPTILEHGRIRFYVIKRGARLGVRVKDSGSAALAAFHGIESFPIDPRWRFDARFDAYDPPRSISVPNILGSIDEEKSPGAVVFTLAGKEYRIDAVREAGSNELFLIFGDQTNGRETYGGGRFLYTALADKEGRVVVDFNKAYNPPCVFSPYATCPLPPTQNRLPLRIEAGEKTYGEH